LPDVRSPLEQPSRSSDTDFVSARHWGRGLSRFRRLQHPKKWSQRAALRPRRRKSRFGGGAAHESARVVEAGFVAGSSRKWLGWFCGIAAISDHISWLPRHRPHYAALIEILSRRAAACNHFRAIAKPVPATRFRHFAGESVNYQSRRHSHRRMKVDDAVRLKNVATAGFHDQGAGIFRPVRQLKYRAFNLVKSRSDGLLSVEKRRMPCRCKGFDPRADQRWWPRQANTPDVKRGLPIEIDTGGHNQVGSRNRFAVGAR